MVAIGKTCSRELFTATLGKCCRSTPARQVRVACLLDDTGWQRVLLIAFIKHCRRTILLRSRDRYVRVARLSYTLHYADMRSQHLQQHWLLVADVC